MGRRASSGPNPGYIIGGLVVAGALIFGGKSLLESKGDSLQGNPLEIDELLQNGNSLRNNEYVFEGEIDEKIQFSGESQLVSVKVRSDGEDNYLGVEIPAEFKKINIEPRQKYLFRVVFKQGGIAVATAIKRI
ncbi:MAG TPA: hypothetical protein VFY13_01975 [Luteolibacter sp.]|nr:hypothetical protein [Luteolibacter sp.]